MGQSPDVLGPLGWGGRVFLPDQSIAGICYHLLGYGAPGGDDEATARSRIGRMASATLRRPISCSSVAAATRPSRDLGDSSASPGRWMSRPGVQGNDVTGDETSSANTILPTGPSIRPERYSLFPTITVSSVTTPSWGPVSIVTAVTARFQSVLRLRWSGTPSRSVLFGGTSDITYPPTVAGPFPGAPPTVFSVPDRP